MWWGSKMNTRSTCGRWLIAAGIAACGWVWPCRAAEWTIESVDTSGAGYYSSLKADREGNLHAAYVGEVWNHPLKYAFWDHMIKRWFTMQVATGASFSTLVLDSKGHPHISFADWGSGLGDKLRHAAWDGSWKVEAIDVHPGAAISYYTSMAFDQMDHPIFTYYDYADPANNFILQLGSVFWEEKFWGVAKVDRTRGSGKFNSVAVDSSGRPHVAYANVSAETESLRYATWNGKRWDTEIIEGKSGPVPVYSVSMVLDNKGIPHIVYTQLGPKLIKYATRVNGKWQIEAVDSYAAAADGDGFWDRDGIAIDPEGNPYVSYFDKGLGVLKVARRLQGRWKVEVVDGNMSGMMSSVAIADGAVWVSYAAIGEQAFKVAHRPLEDTAQTAAPATAQRIKAPGR
jgi:hypothetical protein